MPFFTLSPEAISITHPSHSTAVRSQPAKPRPSYSLYKVCNRHHYGDEATRVSAESKSHGVVKRATSPFSLTVPIWSMNQSFTGPVMQSLFGQIGRAHV